MKKVLNTVQWFFTHPVLMGLFSVVPSSIGIVQIFRADDSDPFLIALAAFFTILTCSSIVIAFLNRKKSNREYIESGLGSSPRNRWPGVNTPLYKVCESLLDVISKNINIIPRLQIQEDAHNLLTDTKKGVLRIYFFGHQKAGKSTLINKLIKSPVTPTSSGKMTTCLIRVRQGKKFSGLAKWSNGAKQPIRPNIQDLKNKMEEWEQLSPDRRPREVVIEVANNILGVSNIELVDTPGTGSIWDGKYGRNVLDDTVSRKIKAAAVAVLIYKYGQAEMQPHGNLLQDLKMRGIKVLGVCNITPDLNSQFQEDETDAWQTISKAENDLRVSADAECHRVVLKEEESLLRLASQIGGETVDEFSTHIVRLLKDKESFVKLQSAREGQIIAKEVLVGATSVVRKYRPTFQEVANKRTAIQKSISDVRSVISEGYNDKDVVSQSTMLGTVGGTGLAVAYVALVATSAAIPFFWIPVGAAAGSLGGSLVGNGIKETRVEAFEKKLKGVWEELQKTIKKSVVKGRPMLSAEVKREVIKLSSPLVKRQKELELTMSNIESDLSVSLQKMEGYDLYRRNEVIVERVSTILKQFEDHHSFIVASRERVI